MNSVTPGKTAVYSAGQSPGQRFKAKAYQYARLMRLDRPIGTFLLLWPMLWALWIAGAGQPNLGVTLVFLLGTLLMRSAGCALNDFADRKFDPEVSRTRDRPLAAGKLAPREAVMVFVALGLIAFALVLTMNMLTVQLAFIGAALAAIYPFTKRYTYLPQVFMGLAFGWAVPMAWAAQTGEVNAIGWLLYLAAVLWATIYDTQYAMVDRDDDLRIGVKSMAILFGPADRLMIGALQIVFLLTLLIIGRQAELGIWYYVGVLVAVALFIYQQHLMRERRPAGCFKAFLNNHWLGAALFAGTVLHYLFSS